MKIYFHLIAFRIVDRPGPVKKYFSLLILYSGFHTRVNDMRWAVQTDHGDSKADSLVEKPGRRKWFGMVLLPEAWETDNKVYWFHAELYSLQRYKESSPSL